MERKRRQLDLPKEYKREAYEEAAKLPRFYIGGAEVEVHYAVSSPEFVGSEESIPADEAVYHLRRQCCTAWVFLENEIVGGVELKRFMVPLGMENHDFLTSMERDAQSEHELSCVLADEFDPVSDEVSDYGDIVELERLWLKPIPGVVGETNEIVEGLLTAFCPRFSMVVLKAYPLEYEGNLPEGSPLFPAFMRRQAAMMRYYSRALGVRPFQSEHGENGWMFRMSSILLGN